jgi:hypothetical protein
LTKKAIVALSDLEQIPRAAQSACCTSTTDISRGRRDCYRIDRFRETQAAVYNRHLQRQHMKLEDKNQPVPGANLATDCQILSCTCLFLQYLVILKEIKGKNAKPLAVVAIWAHPASKNFRTCTCYTESKKRR